MIKKCVMCDAEFDARVHNATMCGDRCRYQRQLKRNKAFADRNPGRNAEWCRNYREKNLEEMRAKDMDRYYNNRRGRLREESTALRMVKMLERYGLAALDHNFKEPDYVVRERDYKREWRAKARTEGRVARNIPERRLGYERAYEAKRKASLQLIRDIQEKGIEALL